MLKRTNKISLDFEIVCPQCLGSGFKGDAIVKDLIYGCDLCGGTGEGKQTLSEVFNVKLGTGYTTIAMLLKKYSKKSV